MSMSLLIKYFGRIFLYILCQSDNDTGPGHSLYKMPRDYHFTPPAARLQGEGNMGNTAIVFVRPENKFSITSLLTRTSFTKVNICYLEHCCVGLTIGFHNHREGLC